MHLWCTRPRFDLWVGKIPWKGKGYPLQYSCLENSTDRGAWQAAVHGVAKSWSQLSDFHFHYGLLRRKFIKDHWTDFLIAITKPGNQQNNTSWFSKMKGSSLRPYIHKIIFKNENKIKMSLHLNNRICYWQIYI